MNQIIDSEGAGMLLDRDDYARLRHIEAMLYGDGAKLSADARRDIANMLRLVLNRTEQLNSREAEA